MVRPWAIYEDTQYGLVLCRYAYWREAVAVVKLNPKLVCINENGDILSQE